MTISVKLLLILKFVILYNLFHIYVVFLILVKKGFCGIQNRASL